jgi:hypothetical protein
VERPRELSTAGRTGGRADSYTDTGPYLHADARAPHADARAAHVDACAAHADARAAHADARAAHADACAAHADACAPHADARAAHADACAPHANTNSEAHAKTNVNQHAQATDVNADQHAQAARATYAGANAYRGLGVERGWSIETRKRAANWIERQATRWRDDETQKGCCDR